MSGHVPVLLAEVIAALAPHDGGIYVDGTFGAGGYSRALLDSCDCTVWGIDRDPEAVARGHALAAEYDGRLRILAGRYGDMDTLLAEHGVSGVDGVALDIGVSSQQIDTAERGFSFRQDGPLDMRMEQAGTTAADLVNTLAEEDLANLLYRFGEERASRRIARAIVARRTETPFERTGELAEVVRSMLPAARDGIDPATRSFQALRIVVNDELGELDRGLVAAERVLVPGGRLAVVAFHSLEDRRVKAFLRTRGGASPNPSRHVPDRPIGPAASFRLLARGAIKAGRDEERTNPRARSARLRAAERTAAPPWPAEQQGGRA